jgi:hypothetical protein
MSAPFAVVTLPDGRQFSAASADVLTRWAKEGRIPADAIITHADQPPIVAARHPALLGMIPGAAPPVQPGPVAAPPQDTAVSVIIPYRNGPALAGYYVSIASLIPGFGLILGPVAIWLGIAGLKKVRREPQAHGTAHAIIAIVLGALTTIFYWGMVILVIATRN